MAIPLDINDRLKYLSAAERERWARFSSQVTGGSAERKDVWRKQWQMNLNLVGAMHQKGVGIMAGTDVGNPYVYPGFGLHDELVLLVKAGLTPMAALQAATMNPARFLNMENDLGTVQKGKIADLVLLNANPLEDIANTQRISAVVMNGRYLPRETLQKMLDEVEASARKTERPRRGRN